jgi:hypothetical protein
MSALAAKFPTIKFVKSISTTCIPNYPDKNLPTIFVYYENELKQQIIGPLSFNGMSYKQDDLEWKLHRIGALRSSLQRNANADFEKESSDRLEKAERDMVRTIRQGIMHSNGNDDDEDLD